MQPLPVGCRTSRAIRDDEAAQQARLCIGHLPRVHLKRVDVRQEERHLGQRRRELVHEHTRCGGRARALRDARSGCLFVGAKREPKDGRIELGVHRASKHSEGRELVRVLLAHARMQKVDHLARLGAAYVGQVRAVRVEHHEVAAGGETRQVGDVVARVEPHAKTARLCACGGLRLLGAANVLDALKIGVREDRVVVRVKRGSLEGACLGCDE